MSSTFASPIHVRAQMRPHGVEIGASSSAVFLKLKDNFLGHFMGLKYDYGAGKWTFYLDTGGQTVTVARSMVDAYFGCNFHAIPQVSGLTIISIYTSTGFLGSLTTPGAWTFDSLYIGAMDNIAGVPVDRYFTQVTVGVTAGASDLMGWNIRPPPSGLPQPFDGMFGTSTVIEANVSTSEIHLFAGSVGDTNAYLVRQWAIQHPPGFETDPLIEPSTSDIIFAGYYGWQMSGKPAWIIDNWGLDRLIIPMRGSRTTLDAFLETLTPWMKHPTYKNMFLSNVTQEQRGSTNFPQIDLTFTGKRKPGTLVTETDLVLDIAPREQQGEQVQQISGRAIWNTAHTVTLTFIGKTSEKTVWSRQPIDLSTVNPLEPPEIELMWLVETDVVYWAGVFETYLGIITTNTNLCFVSRIVTTGVSEEMVPGQYYRATRTVQRLYFPVLG